ncbi:hypothetical protein PGB90_002183 [Kerria lacca]|nr:very long chain fatty acid elongase [Kerria lacca]
MPPNQTMEMAMIQRTTFSNTKSSDSADHDENDMNINTTPSIIWINAISISLFHIISVISFFLTIYKMKFLTILWMIMYGGFAGFGVTAGAHRLWSHRSYKAKLPLQILLLICYSAAGMNSLYDWVRDHRVHHKFSETNADPHNSKRGFFFAHVGWLMQTKHPDVIRKGKNLNMRDIAENPLLQFYNKYFLLFKIIFCFIIPTAIPIYVWQEEWEYAFISQCLLRYMGVLNVTWSVNSFAHIWGTRPYDKRIRPVENLGVAIFALGEGWHNYHHVFPWDYKAAELGNYKVNLTTMWLDLFVKLGLVYDAKQPSAELIKTVIEKYGDCSNYHHISEFHSELAQMKE